MKTFFGIRWNRKHSSSCGRFRCLRIDNGRWELRDVGSPPYIDGPKYTFHPTLQRAKERADYVASK